jgi:aspartyl-tRNA synthetase
LKQLDLEMAFATGKDVRMTVGQLMKSLFQAIRSRYVPIDVNGSQHPKKIQGGASLSQRYGGDHIGIKRISYENAMRKYGIDKPDLRITSPQASYVSLYTFNV